MKTKKITTVAITLICSIALIAVSYWHVNRKKEDAFANNDEAQQMTEKLDGVRGITAGDHVLGNPEATIVFYVYSDFACPYCKQYHETLRTLFSIYGDTGEIAYVFRHMPFVELHPNAPMYALASECVAQEGGQHAFWTFSDTLFEHIDQYVSLSAENIVEMATGVGVGRQQFVSCMRANTLMEDVQADYDEAREAGADGTPFTVVETPGKRSVYNGAQSFKALAYVLKTTLGTLEPKNNSASIKVEDFENISTQTPATSTNATSTNTQNTTPATSTRNEDIE